MRDALAERIAAARVRPQGNGAELEPATKLRGRMLASPAEREWLRISRADVGERRLRALALAARLGPLEMLMGSWRVEGLLRMSVIRTGLQANRRCRPGLEAPPAP